MSTDLPDSTVIPNGFFFCSNVRIKNASRLSLKRSVSVVQLGLFQNVPLVNGPVNENDLILVYQPHAANIILIRS